MSKRISIGALVILLTMAVIVTFQITYLSVSNKYKNLIGDLEMQYESEQAKADENLRKYAKLDEVDKLIRSKYVGEIDETYLSDYIMRGYIAGIGDKYAYYMSSDEYISFVSDQNGEMVGIGVMAIYNGDYAAIEIVTVMPDSPALEAGIQPGDLIVSVGGESVGELGYYPAIKRVQGEAGTNVDFQVVRFNDDTSYEYLDFSITRAAVTSLSVIYRRFEDSNIGIIRILQFDATTPAQFAAAVTDLQSQGVEKFIFDLRNNPGGELTSITSILDTLLPEGPIIRIKDNAGTWNTIESDAKELDAQMAVIVNSSTASAAELFTSAMKDYQKATVVGTATYGKGTMQTVMALSDHSAVSFSTAMYYPPFSDNYEGIGVIPDIESELSEEVSSKNLYKLTDEEDAQLQTALRVLRGEAEAAPSATGADTSGTDTSESTAA